ncbi:MAG: RpoL/Rpb11 RNA polymerase subunit family protein [Candidatus Micrarchaeota archaeon]
MSEKKHGVAFKVVCEEKGYLEVEMPGQDIGFSNLVVEKLLKGKSVSFAAAAYDHPLKCNSVIRIRAKDPAKELHKAFEEVHFEMGAFLRQLEKA